jgi:hypothetical protein
MSILTRWIAYEERRLNLPRHGPGYTVPQVYFLLRIGPWKIENLTLQHEYRAVSANGHITNRRWRQVFPRPKE